MPVSNRGLEQMMNTLADAPALSIVDALARQVAAMITELERYRAWRRDPGLPLEPSGDCYQDPITGMAAASDWRCPYCKALPMMIENVTVTCVNGHGSQ